MDSRCTWASLFLLCTLFPFQSACNKKSRDPNGPRLKDSPTGITTDHPFAQDPGPPTTQKNQDDAQKLLRETVIARVDWPEQPVVDRLALIHQEVSKVGLSVEMSEGIRSRPLKTPALRMRNIPIFTVITYTLDSTILRFRIKDSGVLFFYLAHEETSPPIPREVNGPF
jgi:hypothetical protein